MRSLWLLAWVVTYAKAAAQGRIRSLQVNIQEEIPIGREIVNLKEQFAYADDRFFR